MDAQTESGQIPPELVAEFVKLERGVAAGANWFYWIAALSVVNSVLHVLGQQIHFVLGLGITQLVDGIALAIANRIEGPGANAVTIAATVFNLLVAAVVALLGWQAGKKYGWAFGLGLFVYSLDAIIFLIFQEWYALGFHVFAFFCIASGWSCLRKLNGLYAQLAYATVEVVDPEYPQNPPAN